MSFEGLLISNGTLKRKRAPTYEFGSPVAGSDEFVTVSSFPCRVDFNRGAERPQARSEQTEEVRTATIFCLPDVPVKRQDVIDVDGVGRFEVRGRQLVFGAVAVHHWELTCDIVEGD